MQGVARDADRANKPPYWSFYIWGHFVEPGQTTIPAGAGQKKLNRWTEAMQSIEMRFEEEGGTQLPEVVRWERDRHTGAHRECMEVHRCDILYDLLCVCLLSKNLLISNARGIFHVARTPPLRPLLSPNSRTQVLLGLFAFC